MPDPALAAALAAHDMSKIAAAVRALVEAREPPLIEAIKPHLTGLTLTMDSIALLGRAMMSHCPRVAAPLMARRSGGARSITVMGTSHVRFFGGHPIFFPLFIGMGPHLLCLTPESDAIARRKLHDNLDRIDPADDLILDLGAEPYYHSQNILNTRPDPQPEVTESDLAFMALTAQRYELLLRQVRDRITGRLILFNVLPTYDAVGNALAVVLNDLARGICRELGIRFLDIWDQVVDPADGALRRDLAAKAYNDDTHLSEDALPLVLHALADLGVVDRDLPTRTGAAWRHVYAFPVSPGGDTRVWCEADVIPANAIRSEKVAASYIATAALEILLPIIASQPDARVLMLNVKDGFLAITLPPGAASQVVAICDDADSLNAAERVAAFAGRDDIALVADRESLPVRLSGRQFDLTLVNLHPATIQHDLDRAEALLSVVSPGLLAVIGPGDLHQRNLPPAIGRAHRFYPLGVRHLAGDWPKFGLFLC